MYVNDWWGNNVVVFGLNVIYIKENSIVVLSWYLIFNEVYIIVGLLF